MLDETTDKHTVKTRSSRAAVIVATAAAGIVVVIIVLLISGLYTGAVKLVTEADHSGYQMVCGDDLVDKFNKAVYIDTSQSNKVPDIDRSALESLAAGITKLKNYENDPTCQTLIFLSDIYNYNYDGAKAAYQMVKRQHAEGKYPNNDIFNNQAVSTYDLVLESVMPEPKDAPK